MARICYSVRENRMKSGCLKGFVQEENGSLKTEMKASVHYLYLRGFDCAQEDGRWGRLWFDARIPETMACYVYAVATNEDSFYLENEPVKIDDFLCNPLEEDENKKNFFEQVHAKRFVNQKDMLLYEQKGRYLYLAITLVGTGEGYLSNIRIDRRGDNFMQTFPEVYREENSFFHRYLSIFSSIYNDFQEKIDNLPALLRIEQCPAELLTMYGQWLGIDLNCGFSEEQVLRAFVSEAYELNRIKGTRQAVIRIAKIVLGDEVLILERNAMREYETVEERELYDRLYGRNVYDVTLLVERRISETKKSQLLYMLEQFVPVRTKIRIIFLKRDSMLDTHCYLDMNAEIFTPEQGQLDCAQAMNGIITLA